MAKVCAMQGCKSCEGTCSHEKMMAGMGAMGLLAAIGHWGLGLF